MRVGFLPMIPKPVTEYTTVHKALTNYQSVRRQLNQPILPIVSDEGVFRIVTDYPDIFKDIYPMMGMFHYYKVLLRCSGGLLIGTGLDDGLIEAEVFWKKVVQSVLAGSHYVRAMKGMLIISEVLSRLKWEAFWKSNIVDTNADLTQSIIDFKTSVSSKNLRQNSDEKFHLLLSESDALRLKFEAFVFECEEKSEVCQYLGLFESIIMVVKQMVTADREGNWSLHVAAVRSSMKILRAFDCINYLRYASWYLERIEVLEFEHPKLFSHLMKGQFVVKDR